jgi:hypothetical protein
MEIGWRTSSYTEPEDTCVKVRYLTAAPDEVCLGDTKDAQGAEIKFSAAAWSTFLDGVVGE